MWPIDRPPQWVNRGRELAALSAGVEALRRGGGTAVWVEGEPGIGKSSLVAEALAGVSELGWDVGWGMADQLAERLPLSVIQDCLQVRLGSPDPRRAQAASLLRSQRLGLFADGDAAVSSVEVLMALADELCAAAPTVMVVDDLQWADAAGHRRPAGGGRACTRPGRLDLRGGTAHAALISKILDLPGGYGAAGSPSRGGSGGIVAPGGPDQLTDSETRVLRYLPTHLTAPEIARELFLSVNTVSTHTRHLYAKLGVHGRHEAVDRARALGLLAPPVGRAARDYGTSGLAG